MKNYNRIKEIREKSGFTQKDIALYLGIDQSYVSKIENRERAANAEHISKLSALFGVPISAFFDDNIKTNEVSYAFRASDLSREDMQIISDINRIAMNADFMTKLLGE